MLLAVIIFHFFLAGLHSRVTIRRQGEGILVLFFAPSGSVARLQSGLALGSCFSFTGKAPDNLLMSLEQLYEHIK